ncbi:hypothetical protein RN001_006091 [Aquatica leii]|uniref:Uncharacterized protein n=1 Tax=Aquatica leii TaxID=1421715 RepID=A0AAN7Q280_9COLE|nr:hypothetical protein RN001_006091 [Aquatica leii]
MFNLSKSGLINNAHQKEYVENEIYSASGELCRCMNNHLCKGEINWAIPCHPSYIMVCCVIPSKENIGIFLI